MSDDKINHLSQLLESSLLRMIVRVTKHHLENTFMRFQDIFKITIHVENLLYLLDSLTMICHCSIVEQGCDVSGVSSGLEEMSPSLQVRLLNSNYEHCLSAMNEIFIKLSSNNAGLMQELGLEILNSFREFDVKILQECVDINECSILGEILVLFFSLMV